MTYKIFHSKYKTQNMFVSAGDLKKRLSPSIYHVCDIVAPVGGQKEIRGILLGIKRYLGDTTSIRFCTKKKDVLYFEWYNLVTLKQVSKTEEILFKLEYDL